MVVSRLEFFSLPEPLFCGDFRFAQAAKAASGLSDL
jgi:hypothetical protein